MRSRVCLWQKMILGVFKRQRVCWRKCVLFSELAEKAQQAGRSMSVPVCDEQRAFSLQTANAPGGF